MVKKYSSVDLIAEEMALLTDNSWSGKFLKFTNSKTDVYLKITMPESVLFRMKMLAEQISEQSGEWDIEYQYIADILLEDFIRFINRNNKPIETYKYITQNLKKGYDLIHFREGKKLLDDNKRVVTVPMKFDRKHILRLEVELFDIDEIGDAENDMIVEDILSAIMVDFINNVRAGRASEVINSIVTILNKEED